MPAPTSLISTTDLIGARARALAKRQSDIAAIHTNVHKYRLDAARKLAEDKEHVIHDYNFKRGDLVLLRNTAIEKSLNRKMRPRYLGPFVVLSCNRGGAYIVSEIDGTVLDRPIAAFRVAPYLARSHIDISWLDDSDKFDITTARLRAMEASNSQGDDDPAILDTDIDTPQEIGTDQ